LEPKLRAGFRGTNHERSKVPGEGACDGKRGWGHGNVDAPSIFIQVLSGQRAKKGKVQKGKFLKMQGGQGGEPEGLCGKTKSKKSLMGKRTG